ncbi:c-type cytochrome biogenesis protein CcmI [Niveibacterium umoris]|uniref:Cytochrome c-type biogenesis protein CcmH n=1 Tax=Niveibacterium umoris TaxID=1193620 RepID=A0A840BGY1_9RHOO|nr:c-type cytochrome biogenesis protein CcmI [Niveibacterium umoris]MBB4010928.1 cytochrome c-type biogenesis protein CcmH [Niveibacterium umoris]
MTTFIIATAALTVLVLGLLTRPFIFRRGQAAAVDMGRLNASILRDEIAALEREHASGALTAEEFAAARDDVHRRLIDDAGTATPAAARTTRPRWTVIPVVLLLPLVAGAIYAKLGTPAAVTGIAPQAAAGQPDVNKMVANLAAKLEAEPNNPKGWAMLGRSYKVMGRFNDAAAAFERIGPALEESADWLAEYADTLAMTTGGKLAGKPEAFALKALKLDPEHLLALMLAGSAAAERGDNKTAITYLQHALSKVPDESEDAGFLKNALAELRSRSGEAPLVEAPAAAPSATAKAEATTAPAAATQRSIALAIGIAPALKADAAGKTLFVIARAPGERMPLAVIKRGTEGLPATITLDDSASLNANRPLSSVPAIEIEARVSASGTPQSAPGDLFGIVQVRDANQSALAVQIDQRRQ